MKKPEEIKKGLECCMNYQECAKYGIEECPYNDEIKCMDALLADALALIQQLEAQVPRWISVEERLPERHGQQCVGLYSIGEYKGYLTPYVFTWHAYGNNGYVDGPHFNDEGLDGLKVHYWMPLPPLPEPPKEDEK